MGKLCLGRQAGATGAIPPNCGEHASKRPPRCTQHTAPPDPIHCLFLQNKFEDCFRKQLLRFGIPFFDHQLPFKYKRRFTKEPNKSVTMNVRIVEGVL